MWVYQGNFWFGNFKGVVSITMTKKPTIENFMQKLFDQSDANKVRAPHRILTSNSITAQSALAFTFEQIFDRFENFVALKLKTSTLRALIWRSFVVFTTIERQWSIEIEEGFVTFFSFIIQVQNTK